MAFFSNIYQSWSGTQEDKYHKILESAEGAGIDFSVPVLDIGCGPFFFERFLERNCISTDNFICIDVEKQDKNDMKKREFSLANAEKLPFAGNSFSLLVCIDVAHRIPKLTELRRVLKPGGSIIITSFFNFTNQQEVEKALIAKLNGFKITSKTIFKGRESEIIIIAKKDAAKRRA